MGQVIALSPRAARNFPVKEKGADDPARPYRLWDSTENKQVRWKCYLNLRNAHDGALHEAAWSDGSTVIELFDIRNGGLRGQYKRIGNSIEFWRSKDKLEDN